MPGSETFTPEPSADHPGEVNPHLENPHSDLLVDDDVWAPARPGATGETVGTIIDTTATEVKKQVGDVKLRPLTTEKADSDQLAGDARRRLRDIFKKDKTTTAAPKNHQMKDAADASTASKPEVPAEAQDHKTTNSKDAERKDGLLWRGIYKTARGTGRLIGKAKGKRMAAKAAKSQQSAAAMTTSGSASQPTPEQANQPVKTEVMPTINQPKGPHQKGDRILVDFGGNEPGLQYEMHTYKNGAEHVNVIDADGKRHNYSQARLLAEYGYDETWTQDAEGNVYHGKELVKPAIIDTPSPRTKSGKSSLRHKLNPNTWANALNIRLMERSDRRSAAAELDSQKEKHTKRNVAIGAAALAGVGLTAYLLNKYGGSDALTGGVKKTVNAGKKAHEQRPGHTGLSTAQQINVAKWHAAEGGHTPWQIAHDLKPGHERVVMQNSLNVFNREHGTNFRLAAHKGSTWIMDGKRAINPAQQAELESIMVGN